jgi:hypothetical protein
MARALIPAVSLLALAGFLTAAPAPTESGPGFIDLAPHANAKLAENFHGDAFAGNNLAKLPTGKQTFAGVKFKVGDACVQLGSNQTKDVPLKVEGIKVGRAVGKLHFLHACGWQGADGQLIGKYVVHYDDDTTAEVEIVYGKDVVDWWFKEGQKAPTRSKVAWEGDNEAAKGNGARLQLYLTTWENPHPKKKVVAIDYVATAPEGVAAPFCVAITAEEK